MRWSKSCPLVPAKTPTRLPRSDEGSIRASSIAVHDVSSSSRCCGSMATASRGEMPKKCASNASASARKAPRVTSGGSADRSQCRSVGRSVIASTPSASSRQNSAGELAPPGKRQPMPTMTIGSSSTGRTVGVSVAVCPPVSSVRRWAARASGLGWSNAIVAGSVRPVAVSSRLRSSTAVSEVNPRSRNARWLGTWSALPWPRTAAISARTSSPRVSCCSVGVRPASRRRSVAARSSSTGAVTAVSRSRISGSGR